MKKLLAQLDVETFVFDLQSNLTISTLTQFTEQSESIAYRVIDDHTLEVDLNKSQNLIQIFEQLNAANIECCQRKISTLFTTGLLFHSVKYYVFINFHFGGIRLSTLNTHTAKIL